jgi:uncharacterized protein (DUF2236 family)
MRLPPPLQSWAETLVAGFLAGGEHVADFAAPAGEPALAGPDSVAWMVFKNPAALLAGGVAAVLLELAEPRVRAGVWEHSRFRADPVGRIRRTGLAALVTVYGARSQAEALIARVGRMHAGVSGVLETGEPYSAQEPELLTWVQATALYGFAEAWSWLVRPLTTLERDRLCTDGLPAAALYGATGAPRSWAELKGVLERMRPRLEPSPIVFEFLAAVRRAPLLPWPLRPVQAALIETAIEILPPDMAQVLGLDRISRLTAPGRGLARAVGLAAERIEITTGPAAQACVRLGLPAGWLYETGRSDARA